MEKKSKIVKNDTEVTKKGFKLDIAARILTPLLVLPLANSFDYIKGNIFFTIITLSLLIAYGVSFCGRYKSVYAKAVFSKRVERVRKKVFPVLCFLWIAVIALVILGMSINGENNIVYLKIVITGIMFCIIILRFMLEVQQQKALGISGEFDK